MRNFSKIFAVAVVLGYTLGHAVGQCSMCVATVESNDENLVGRGLNSGIIFLMMAPYLLVGTATYIWFKYYRKK